MIYGKLAGGSQCRVCVTQVDLQRIPPFWKFHRERAPKKEVRLQPFGKDIALSSGRAESPPR